MMWEEYFYPKSIREALEILNSYKGEARVIAGGTDLIPQLKKRIRKIRCLVDISRIETLCKIERDGDTIKIGAGITHSEVVSSTDIREQAILLSEASSTIGSPLIRNQATVIGNVINAQPAADTAVALFALDAQVEIFSQAGIKVVPIHEVYQDIGISRIDSTAEVASAIWFKCLKNNQGSAFSRLSWRKALSLPVLNVAIVVTVRDASFQEIRIAMGPVARFPFRLGQTESILKGRPVGLDLIREAAEVGASETHPRNSPLRGSAEYRKEMAKVLLRRTLQNALFRIKKD
jgi:CO/xanthine dehydrogenase FAD-binding subunit